MKVLSAVIFCLSSLACSSQLVYDASRHNAQVKCQELPQNQYEECMAEVTETYEVYSRKRKEIVEEE